MKFDLDLGIRLLAEFCATAMFMCLFPMSAIKDIAFPNNLLQTSFGCGLTIGLVVHCFGYISGAHINPTVSLANYIMGFMSLPMLGLYVLAQILGSILGYALFIAILPWSVVTRSPSLTIPHPLIGDGQALGIEFISTSAFILFWCSMWAPPNASHVDGKPLKFAHVAILLVLTSGYYTGASFNPVRTLVPAIFHNTYTKIWIYFSSQILASVCMALAWRFIFGVKKKEEKAVAADTSP